MQEQEECYEGARHYPASLTTSAGLPNPALVCGAFVATVANGRLSSGYSSWSRGGYELSYFDE